MNVARVKKLISDIKEIESKELHKDIKEQLIEELIIKFVEEK